MDKGDDLLQSNVVFVVLMLPVPLFYSWLGAPTGNCDGDGDVWTTGVGVSLCRVRQSCSCWRLKRQHRLLSPLFSINSHDNKYSAEEKDLLKCGEYLYLDSSPSCKKLDYSLTNHGEKCLLRSQTWDKKERDLKETCHLAVVLLSRQDIYFLWGGDPRCLAWHINQQRKSQKPGGVSAKFDQLPHTEIPQSEEITEPLWPVKFWKTLASTVLYEQGCK